MAAHETHAETWPALPVADWQDTRDTLHLWTQMVGKLRLELTPRVNHWWNVPLYIDARGLTTSLMPCGPYGLEARFDFFAHELVFERTDGARRTIASAGYWPGGADEGAFYSYTYPEPAGFRERELGVPGASFDTSLGEFLLPYRAVREASDPEALLLAFLRATYRAGAEAGAWPQAGDAAVS